MFRTRMELCLGQEWKKFKTRMESFQDKNGIIFRTRMILCLGQEYNYVQDKNGIIFRARMILCLGQE